MSKSSVTHSYRILNRELNLATKLRRPQTIVPRLASDCGLPGRINYRARYLAKIAERTGIANGRKPAGVAAACLYQAAQERNHLVTQQEIADAADVSTPTLRKRHFELEEELEEDDHSLRID